jgi:hypothetical protein
MSVRVVVFGAAVTSTAISAVSGTPLFFQE